MTNYKQLCVELVNELHGYKVAHPNHDTDLIDRARAALAEPELERLTVQEISNLPQHGENYIGEHRDGEIHLDGYFSRADLQQLADQFPAPMTDNNHLITPPPELVEQWMTEIWHEGTPVRVAISDLHIATQAARWGADQELEACCKDILELIAGIYADRVIKDWSEFVALLRDGRRPTEAVLALDAFDRLQAGNGTDEDWRLVRRKLEKDCDD